MEGGHLRIVHDIFELLDRRTEYGLIRDVDDSSKILARLAYGVVEDDAISVTWVVNPDGEISDEWALDKFFTGGGDDVGYIFGKKINGKDNIDIEAVTASIASSMLSVTLADTDKYGDRVVPVRVVDRLVKEGFFNEDGEYQEAVYEDEFAFTVTARRNRAPVLGDTRDLGSATVGNQKMKTAPVVPTQIKHADADISSGHFVDDDPLTFLSGTQSSKASFGADAVSGKESTWDATNSNHAPVVLDVYARDSGYLLTKSIPVQVIVDGAPSASSAASPVTVIEDTGATVEASFNWWQFFGDMEGPFSSTATWAQLTDDAPDRWGADQTTDVDDAEKPISATDTNSYSLRAWSSDPGIVVVAGNADNSTSMPLAAATSLVTSGATEGRLQFVGNAVGEAMITVVLTEPSGAVYSVVSADPQVQSDANLVHAGFGQYAVKRFKVKVVERDTSRPTG